MTAPTLNHSESCYHLHYSSYKHSSTRQPLSILSLLRETHTCHVRMEQLYLRHWSLETADVLLQFHTPAAFYLFFCFLAHCRKLNSLIVPNSVFVGSERRPETACSLPVSCIWWILPEFYRTQAAQAQDDLLNIKHHRNVRKRKTCRRDTRHI